MMCQPKLARFGGAFSVARLCKDAAGLSVPLGEVGTTFLGAPDRQACPSPSGRMPRRDPAERATLPADALAKRPTEEILFEWFRSGRLVGELSVLMKRRHPDVQAEIDRVYREHLAKLGKRERSSLARRRSDAGL